jgi:uncharacterized membrane protein
MTKRRPADNMGDAFGEDADGDIVDVPEAGEPDDEPGNVAIEDDVTEELSVEDLVDEAYLIGTTDSLREIADLPVEEQLGVEPLLAYDRQSHEGGDGAAEPDGGAGPDGSWQEALPGGEAADDLAVIDVLESELLARGHLEAEAMAQEALGDALLEAGAIDPADLLEQELSSELPIRPATPTQLTTTDDSDELTDQWRIDPMDNSEYGPGTPGAEDPMTTGMITGGADDTTDTAQRAEQVVHDKAQASSGMMHSLVATIEEEHRLDAVGDRMAGLAYPLEEGPAGTFLRGEWLGHALHPLMTDFPLGCWLSAGLLDVVGGRHTRKAAERLVGLGLLASLPTAAAGLVEWRRIEDDKTRRVGTAHGVGNAGVAILYFQSWRSRRRGRQVRGVLWGMAGASLAWGTGYLGGHLSMARGVGTGHRGAPGLPLNREADEMGPTPPATLVDESMVSSSPR